jgi:uncharacterized protein (TIGR03437 family)
MYITGEGAVTPSLATGATPGPRATTPAPKQPISITVGGVPVPASSIEFAGVPNGLVGVTQVNFTIPSNVPTGAQPVVVTQGTTSSPAGMITITQ